METTLNEKRGMPLKEKLRVVLVITAKDMLEGIRNKTTLTVIIMSIFLIVLYRLLPVIGGSDPTRVFLYETRPSETLADLEYSTEIDVRQSPSIEALTRRIGDGGEPELGLVVPPDFEARVAAGEIPELKGYVVQWLPQHDAEQLVAETEEAIFTETGLNVRIVLMEDRVNPAVDNDGAAFTASLASIFSLCMLGISFIPHLMIEEKSSRTLDALMVSPASSGTLVVSKALTGISYGLLIGIPSLLIYGKVIQNWGVAGLAILTGTVFFVSIGLLLGTVLNTRQQLMAWAWVPIIPLMFPPFLVVMEELIPAWLIELMPWVPTVAMSMLIRASAAVRIPLALILRNLAIILAGTGLVLGFTVSRIRRRDR